MSEPGDPNNIGASAAAEAIERMKAQQKKQQNTPQISKDDFVGPLQQAPENFTPQEGDFSWVKNQKKASGPVAEGHRRKMEGGATASKKKSIDNTVVVDDADQKKKKSKAESGLLSKISTADLIARITEIEKNNEIGQLEQEKFDVGGIVDTTAQPSSDRDLMDQAPDRLQKIDAEIVERKSYRKEAQERLVRKKSELAALQQEIFDIGSLDSTDNKSDARDVMDAAPERLKELQKKAAALEVEIALLEDFFRQEKEVKAAVAQEKKFEILSKNVEAKRLAYIKQDLERDKKVSGLKRFFGRKPDLGHFEEDHKNALEEYQSALRSYFESRTENTNPQDIEKLVQEIGKDEFLNRENTRTQVRQEQMGHFGIFTKKITEGIEGYRKLSLTKKLLIGGALAVPTIAAGAWAGAGVAAGVGFGTWAGRLGLSFGAGTLGFKASLDSNTENVRDKEHQMEQQVLGLENFLNKQIQEVDLQFQKQKNERLHNDRRAILYAAGLTTVMAVVGRVAGSWFADKMMSVASPDDASMAKSVETQKPYEQVGTGDHHPNRSEVDFAFSGDSSVDQLDNHPEWKETVITIDEKGEGIIAAIRQNLMETENMSRADAGKEAFRIIHEYAADHGKTVDDFGKVFLDDHIKLFTDPDTGEHAMIFLSDENTPEPGRLPEKSPSSTSAETPSRGAAPEGLPLQQVVEARTYTPNEYNQFYYEAPAAVQQQIDAHARETITDIFYDVNFSTQNTDVWAQQKALSESDLLNTITNSSVQSIMNDHGAHTWAPEQIRDLRSYVSNAEALYGTLAKPDDLSVSQYVGRIETLQEMAKYQGGIGMGSPGEGGIVGQGAEAVTREATTLNDPDAGNTTTNASVEISDNTTSNTEYPTSADALKHAQENGPAHNMETAPGGDTNILANEAGASATGLTTAQMENFTPSGIEQWVMEPGRDYSHASEVILTWMGKEATRLGDGSSAFSMAKDLFEKYAENLSDAKKEDFLSYLGRDAHARTGFGGSYRLYSQNALEAVERYARQALNRINR